MVVYFVFSRCLHWLFSLLLGAVWLLWLDWRLKPILRSFGGMSALWLSMCWWVKLLFSILCCQPENTTPSKLLSFSSYVFTSTMWWSAQRTVKNIILFFALTLMFLNILLYLISKFLSFLGRWRTIRRKSYYRCIMMTWRICEDLKILPQIFCVNTYCWGKTHTYFTLLHLVLWALTYLNRYKQFCVINWHLSE